MQMYSPLIKTNVNVLTDGHWVSSNLESLDKQKEEFIFVWKINSDIQQCYSTNDYWTMYKKGARYLYKRWGSCINHIHISILTIFLFYKSLFSCKPICMFFFLVISTMGNEVSDNKVYCWSSSFSLMRLSLHCLCITNANESSVRTGMKEYIQDNSKRR